MSALFVVIWALCCVGGCTAGCTCLERESMTFCDRDSSITEIRELPAACRNKTKILAYQDHQDCLEHIKTLFPQLETVEGDNAPCQCWCGQGVADKRCSCLPFTLLPALSTTTPPPSSGDKKSALVIGCSAGASVLILLILSLLFGIWFIRRRRRNGDRLALLTEEDGGE